MSQLQSQQYQAQENIENNQNQQFVNNTNLPSEIIHNDTKEEETN